MSPSGYSQLPAVIQQLWCAWNARDLDGVLACLHPDYESLHPLHPERNFRGHLAACCSWAAVFEALPDFHAELCDYAVAGDQVWTEWRWDGAPTDGAPYHAGGVMVFGLCGAQIAWARVYTDVMDIVGPDFDRILNEILQAAATE